MQTVTAHFIQANDLIAIGDIGDALPAEYDLTNIAYVHVWEARHGDDNDTHLLIALPAIFESVSVTIPSDTRVTIKR